MDSSDEDQTTFIKGSLVHLVIQEEVFLHNAEASGDGQQLLLLLFLFGQVGEEHHLAAVTFDLTDGSVHRPVRRPLVFLRAKHNGPSV